MILLYIMFTILCIATILIIISLILKNRIVGTIGVTLLVFLIVFIIWFVSYSIRKDEELYKRQFPNEEYSHEEGK